MNFDLFLKFPFILFICILIFLTTTWSMISGSELEEQADQDMKKEIDGKFITVEALYMVFFYCLGLLTVPGPAGMGELTAEPAFILFACFLVGTVIRRFARFGRKIHPKKINMKLITKHAAIVTGIYALGLMTAM